MKEDIKQHGFTVPTITPDHYVFGAEMVPRVVISPNGQWLDTLPATEKQSNDSLETYGCTVFGTLNALEILKKALDTEKNYSDRFTYITSETAPPGNDPHVVAESIRSSGVIDEYELPFSSDIVTLDEFRDMGDSGPTFLKEGLTWTQSFDFKHEWLWNDGTSLADKQKILLECLTYSPIGASVRAWIQDPSTGLYIKPTGAPDTHWCVIVGYVLNEYWIIFDTYPNSDGSFLKKLAWDYDFGFSKRYYLQPATSPVEPQIPPTPIVPAPSVKIGLLALIWGFIKLLVSAILKKP